MISFTPSITLGTIIEVLVLAGGGLAFVYNLKAKISILSLEIKHLKEQIQALASIAQQVAETLTKVAVQDQRILNIEQDIRLIQQGESYVLPTRRGAYEVGGS